MRSKRMMVSLFLGLIFGLAPFVYAENADIAPALKQEVIKALKDFETAGPEEYELIELWDQSGASYIRELTAPADKADSFVDEETQRLMVGIYLVDLNYAAVFKKDKDCAEFAKAINLLLGKLGFRDKELTDQYREIMTAADTGEDQAILYRKLSDTVDRIWEDYIGTEDGLKLAVDGTYGWLIEGLYLACEITAQKNYDAVFLAYLQEQMTYLHSMEKLLTLLAKYPELAEMFETSERQPMILEILQTIRITNLVGARQVDAIRELITQARNDIVE